jgi:PAS domain S-box-containing protein
MLMISVLYVDDEPDLSELCRIFLEQTGEFTVETAESGPEALAILGEKQYDAIISDYWLPEMDGISLLKSIRLRCSDTPFILFTGRGREEVAIEALNNGADFYIQKGGDPDVQFAELIHKVRQAVDKKRAEKKLHESEKRLTEAMRQSEILYDTLADAVQDLIYIINRDDTISYVNTCAAMMAGRNRQCLTGMPRTALFPEPDGDQHYRNLQKVFATAMPLRAEGRVHLPSRAAVLDTTLIPLKDPDGIVAAVMGISRDITTMKQAEDALRSSESHYRTIIENVQDTLYRTDTDGKITMISPVGAKHAGYDSPDEMIGMDLTRDLYADPEERKKFLAILAKKGSVTAYPLILRARDGRKYHVTASSHYFYDAEGNVLGTEGILHDVTDLRRTETALKEANRKLNLLNSITRHDVANQLTVLQGYSQLAMLKNADSVIGDFLQKIDSVTATIARQIEFSKAYHELGVHAPGWFGLDEIFAKNKPRDILFSSSCPPLEIFADPMLEKVFANLFGNSVMHGERVTRISVSCEPAGDGLLVTVEDNGVGIPLDLKQAIFKKGFGKNTGFGLFLAREILAITGISIHETGKHGSGARFEIMVPKNGFRQLGETGDHNA